MTDDKVALLKSMVERADALLGDLRSIYDRDLEAQQVSPEALNLTHEVIEKCSNALDQSMALLFEREIKPHLERVPTRGGYFPAAGDEQSYRSTLGQWGAADLANLNPQVDAKLRSLQPFADGANAIYGKIKSFAAHKHNGLKPQKRLQEKRVTVSRSGMGGVSWGSGVTFGSGVSVMGVPINPITQMPVHDRGIDVAVEQWVSFLIEETGENALGFCTSAVAATKAAVVSLLD